ncbi:hypothetical protein WP50_18760, partial [Lactiplantibacillus plantarum]
RRFESPRKQGMFYAPDPGSKPISGIGGNVATNAGGMSTVKYGATKDNVLGVKVVLADGREVKLGGRTLKQAFGYDLTQLMIGSEGTLGIITEVIVKLLPIPLGTPVMGVAFFDNMTALAKAVIEPGVVNGDLDKEARKQGMFYAPDPGSKPISGIGGNVATNAGGMSTVKYGATKDNVLGVKVVLADGREVKLGGRTLKQAFGYDLTQLMIGSEGTLGIITEVIVKLLPIPLGTPPAG